MSPASPSLIQAQHSGIGASIEWLEAQAGARLHAAASTLTSFRLYNAMSASVGETRDVLLTVDEWLACETRPASRQREGRASSASI